MTDAFIKPCPTCGDGKGETQIVGSFLHRVICTSPHCGASGQFYNANELGGADQAKERAIAWWNRQRRT